MANETILIVDADTKSQKVLEVSFKKAGHRVLISESIADAHDQVARAHPSLIVANTTLPDGDGLEFCADLKLTGDTEEIPLIFLTEDRSLTQKMRAFELGADDYLTKPIYIKEVITRAELLIQRRAKALLSESEIEEFTGDLADITMFDLLQTIEKEQQSGSIRLHRQGRQAALFFREGRILDAVCGKLQGEEALYRIMLWSEGTFVMRHHDNARRIDHIEKDASTLLIEGIRRMEKVGELSEQLPAPERIFELDYQRLPALLRTLPPEVEQVVRLFDGYRRLSEVLEDSPVDDVATLQIVLKVLGDDLLIDVTPASGEERPQKRPQKKTLDEWLQSESATVEQASQARASASDYESDDNTDRIGKPPVGRFMDSPAFEDEVDTEELDREKDSQEPEGSDSGVGGGHWKFHWGGNTPDDGLQAIPRQDSQDTAEFAREQRSEDEAGEEQTTEEQAPPSDQEISSGLKELEEQERRRREEEARRLASQRETSQSVALSDDSAPSESSEHASLFEAADQATQLTPSRRRRSTPLSSPAIAVATLLEEEESQRSEASPAHSFEDRTEYPTARIRVPEELKEARNALKPDPAEDSDDQAESNDVDSAPLQEQDSSGDEIFGGDEENTEVLSQEEESASEEAEVPSSQEAPETAEFDSSVFEKFDPDHEEGTDEHPPPPELFPPAALVERNAVDNQVVVAEYELKKRSGRRRQKADVEAGLPAEDEPTPPPQINLAIAEQSASQTESVLEDESAPEVSPAKDEAPPLVDEQVAEQDAQHDDESESESEEKAEAETTAEVEEKETAEEPAEIEEKEAAEEQEAAKAEEREAEEREAEEKASATLAASAPEDSFLDRGEKLHEFDENFEHDLQIGSSSWQKWVIFAAGASLVAVILAVMSISGGDDEPHVEPLPEAVSDAPEADEPAVEEIVQAEPEPVEEPEPTGLDMSQARLRAEVEGASVEFAARDLTQVLHSLQPAVEEQPEPVAQAEAPPQRTEPVAQTEPTRATEQAPTEQPERTVAQDVQRLRTLIDRDQIDEALTLARELTARAPNHRQAAFLHGQAALYANQNGEAIEHLRRAQRLGLNSGDLFLELATAYQITGRRDEARQAYESFLEVQPSGRAADEVRTILETQF